MTRQPQQSAAGAVGWGQSSWSTGGIPAPPPVGMNTWGMSRQGQQGQQGRMMQGQQGQGQQQRSRMFPGMQQQQHQMGFNPQQQQFQRGRKGPFQKGGDLMMGDEVRKTY